MYAFEVENRLEIIKQLTVEIELSARLLTVRRCSVSGSIRPEVLLLSAVAISKQRWTTTFKSFLDINSATYDCLVGRVPG